jgi:hypothetical protein
MAKLTRVHAKKLLIAAVGVASVNYVVAGCGGQSASSGNLVPPPADASADASHDEDVFIVSGNLAAPPDSTGGFGYDASESADATTDAEKTGADATTDARTDGARDSAADALEDRFIISGNLAPPPIDAGDN